MSKTATLATVLLLSLLAAPARAELPPDAAASVHGTLVSRDDMNREVARRLGRSEAGERVLQRLLVAAAIDHEAARRSVMVSRSELADYVAGLEKKAGGKEALEQTLAKEGRTRAELLKMARLSLLGQKMAASDLGLKTTPAPAQIQIWLDSMVKKLGGQVDPTKLPAGVVGRIAKTDIRDVDLGAALAREAGPTLVGERVLEPLLAVIAIERELTANDVSVTDEEVEEDLVRRKKAFEATAQARSLKLTFEKMLEAQQGKTLDDLRNDREYRAVLGFRKHLGQQISDEALAAWFEENRGIFGEQRSVQQILVRAGKDERFESGGRSETEARRIAEDVVARLRAGDPWETQATRSDTKGADKSFLVNPKTTAPEPVLEAIWAAKPGEILGPVKSLFGYHVLRVVEVLPPRTFEESKEFVRQTLVREREQKFYRALRTDPGIVRAAEFRSE